MPRRKGPLPTDLQKIFDHQTGDPDLSKETRLLRTLLEELMKDPLTYQRPIIETTLAIARLIYIQSRTTGSISDLERSIEDIAEGVLNRAELDNAT
jgi:hypothetical protein